MHKWSTDKLGPRCVIVNPNFDSKGRVEVLNLKNCRKIVLMPGSVTAMENTRIKDDVIRQDTYALSLFASNATPSTR